ncbi:MAG: pyrroloquinoline quinone-dependent dehydrogenase [Acidobacteriota bacterium]|nr:pyrroloquinoline quinone-dependent dehydrogenase [Acidobacteriota bacterium]
MRDTSTGRLLLGGLVVATLAAGSASAQEHQWRHWGGDAASSRYAPYDQIDASNFEELGIAWIWKGDNFGPSTDFILRSTPIYVDGKLFTVAGQRRTAVALDPATGETLWTFREPPTQRWQNSMRKNYGKGVAYAEIGGRSRIYLVTPAFFLHALDPETGLPIEDFGDGGTVDLLADFGYDYDRDAGIPLEVGYITNSSPPIVVNGVIVVGNAHQQGYRQSRIENVPGHILAYDAATGEHKWKFNVLPQPGEFGHETWENDAWRSVGNLSSWAPLSADPELGLVYFATDGATIDNWGGFHPGDNLYGTSLVAVDVATGERRWHFQIVHHDVWNYDNPTAPNLIDITVDGMRMPAIVQTTKQSFAYVFNRATGEPIWPIEERPVPQSSIPGEKLSPTQPFPTRPAAYEQQGITEDDLIDYTPELRAEALEAVADWQMGPLFLPPLHRDNSLGLKGSLNCPGGNGGTNIPGGAAVDPETGILYVASIRSCGGFSLIPGEEQTNPDYQLTGTTVSKFVSGGRGPGRIRGLPLLKPPYGRITAIDLNTGEHLWWIPNGDRPDYIDQHPDLAGLDIPNPGQGTHATKLITKTLLMYGEGRGAPGRFHAHDKRTGERIGTVEIPASTNTIPMSYMHEGKQYVVLSVGGRTYSGSHVALSLP